jgi:hypothetical protein
MTKPEELREKIDVLKIDKVKQINVIATADEKELVEGLTSFLSEVKATFQGQARRLLKLSVTDRYFRATAKNRFPLCL